MIQFVRTGKCTLAGLIVVLVCFGLGWAQSITSWHSTYGKSPTEFTSAEWREIIDARWGQGAITQSKLAFFDEWFNLVDTRFGAFQGLDFDITAFRDQYRPEIEQGVSRGRFAAIMTHFARKLSDLHTYLFDTGVRNAPRAKGTPLFWLGQFGNNSGFGAVVTPLPDSTLLVYRVLPNHPLNLVPGDVVLGYDGVLWKDIYPRLMDAELPLFPNQTNASTEEANAYYLLASVGLNWHLFDTLDVVKYATGDTLHFDTNLLANERRTIWAREGMDISGVEWPDRNVDRVSFGVIDGTNVGFVYATSWSFDTPGGVQFMIREQFRQAIVNLWFTQNVDALILDFRFNTGGGALARDGWNLLFNQNTATIGFDERADPDDHFAMREDPLRRAAGLVINPDPFTYWDKPIAVLHGPGSISAGELESLRASFHPRTRRFGLPAPGGNTGSIFPNFSRPEFFGSLATSNMFLVENHEYLAGKGLQPDERVWLTKDDVAKGTDSVVEAALAWIQKEIVAAEIEELPRSSDLVEVDVFPNPFVTDAVVELDVESLTSLDVIVTDVLGRKVASLASGPQPTGRLRLRWDGTINGTSSAASGVYLLNVSSEGWSKTKLITKVD